MAGQGELQLLGGAGWSGAGVQQGEAGRGECVAACCSAVQVCRLQHGAQASMTTRLV
jgi:hypothetical protein